MLFLSFSLFFILRLYLFVYLVSLAVAGFMVSRAPSLLSKIHLCVLYDARRLLRNTIVSCDIALANTYLYFSFSSSALPSFLSLSLHLRNEITLLLYSASLRPETQRVTVLSSVDDYALFLSLSRSLLREGGYVYECNNAFVRCD